MEVYFLRHGEAQREASSDDQRELTNLGRAETTKVMNWLKSKNPKIDLIVASPYVRACQTAEIVQDVLGIKEIFVSDNITPDSEIENILPVLENIQDKNVLIVTHMPFIKDTVLALLDDKQNKNISFVTSGLACLSLSKIEFKSGVLNWVTSPEKIKN